VRQSPKLKQNLQPLGRREPAVVVARGRFGLAKSPKLGNDRVHASILRAGALESYARAVVQALRGRRILTVTPPVAATCRPSALFQLSAVSYQQSAANIQLSATCKNAPLAGIG
jgi:hypothetical protein